MPPKKTTKKTARKAEPKKAPRRAKSAEHTAGETTTTVASRPRAGGTTRRGGAGTEGITRRRRERAPAAAVGHDALTGARPESAVSLEPVSKPSPGTGGAVVEEVNGKIIVRFPPAAPHPFPPPETSPIIPAGPRVAPPPPAQPAPRADDRRPAPTPDRERREERIPVAREVPRPEAPPRREPPAEPLEPRPSGFEEGDGSEMSRSKRRRMRRRRRREQIEQDGGLHGDVTRPMDRDPERAAPREELQEDLAEDDEAQPWLSAAEAIREEMRHPDVAGDADVDEPLEVSEPTDREIDEPDEQAETPELEHLPADREHDFEGERPDRGERRGRRRRRGRGGRGRGEVRVEREPDTRDRGAPSAAGGVREMIINAIPREECRIAILQGGRLEEIYMERATAENHVGNIYKGVVTNVEASIQAAFVDFGQGKNGFLHISDLHPQYFPDGNQQTENVGHKMPRRHRPPIQKCLRRGQEVIVQVTKEGIGTKGPTLSTYLSIPGRFLVMMPGMGKLGVSRRIEDDEQRDQLRDVLNQLELPEGMGFIARTAALERNKGELQNDLNYLTRLWRAVENRTRNDAAPAELYRESDLMIRTIRDVFTEDVQRIIVDDPDVAQRARNFLNIFSPEAADLVTVFDGAEPIFHRYGIEQELERLHSRRVPLPAGGSLVIEPTEALVAIDVNSGSFRTEDDAENTAFKINIEAADEIARQLRLRDLGGVIICDFIDMRLESHRREIERRLTVNLREHKERVKVLRMSEFGIIELTRQRQRASLTRSVYQDCRHCRGTGLVKTIESVALDVMRLIQLAVTRQHIASIEVAISPDVAYLLQNRKRRLLHELETNNRRTISIRPDPNFSLDQVEIHCTDARGRVVPHA